MNVYELNMDGLVGQTHHYAGLSSGNIASTNNALSISNPQAAARQGLEKMRRLYNMGLKQGLLPPHQRPNLNLLYQLGFKGTPSEQINKAYKTAPELLSACYSASCMWTANAATVSASVDTEDNKVHFTAANLISNLHRHQEADFSKNYWNLSFPILIILIITPCYPNQWAQAMREQLIIIAYVKVMRTQGLTFLYTVKKCWEIINSNRAQ